jgi:Sulfotransferase family
VEQGQDGWLPLKGPTTPSDWRRLRLTSTWRGLSEPRLRDIERVCFFIGYGRSGHTAIGSVLNAHPEMVISHELNLFRYVEEGFSRRQLFALMLLRDQQFAARGRIWTGYDYTVPNQSQGCFTRLRVIGDKKGGRSAQIIDSQPELVDRLRRTVRMPLRVIQVVRNPFDNLVTQSVRVNLTLPEAIEWYDERSRGVLRARSLFDASEVIDVQHEEFVRDPKGTLTRLCGFLGVEACESYLDDCASIVNPGNSRRRDSVTWTKDERHRVQEIIDQYTFLSGYTFET